MNEIAFLDATAQAELIRRKEVSSEELVSSAIERIERLNPVLNAVIHPLYEQARETSRAPLPGPFSGVPFLVKDLAAEVEGAPLADGSGFAAGRYLSGSDSELVRRFKAAGLIILGKTNTSEFGLLPTTEPERFGPTRNPWDTSRGPGGSSGGSAAAVASGMVAAGHASDGGGSIRIPASCCGLVGLKPTRGRNSLAPAIGDIAGGIIHEHVVTRSVRDSAAILDATAGAMPGDPYYPPRPERAFAEETGRDPGRLRIGLGTVPLNQATAHPECIAAAQSVAALCEELGHGVEEASPRVDSGSLFRSFGQVMTGYLGWNIAAWERRTGHAPVEEDFEAATWRTYQHSLTQSGGDYLLAWQDLQKSCRDFAAFFTDYDLWLTPTLAQPPVPLGYFDYTHETRKQYIAHLGDFTCFTLIANATGQPAISLPLYWTESGLPVGVQLTGRYGDEATLIRMAAQLERARPWSHRRPPLEESNDPLD
ncbi:MAG: amidase [Gammaproteobacteria bacterium]|jgi:amidase|nr:amidase [Gammaproteobacteria bacterium]